MEGYGEPVPVYQYTGTGTSLDAQMSLPSQPTLTLVTWT